MKSIVALLFFLVSLQAFAADLANPQYVGGIGINPSQDAKVLADWYSKVGIQTQAGDDGGFYATIDTLAGPFYFGIHKKDPNYFSRFFKNFTESTPGEFRSKVRRVRRG